MTCEEAKHVHEAIAKFKFDVVILYTHNFDVDVGVLRHHMYASQVKTRRVGYREGGRRQGEGRKKVLKCG